MRKLMTILACVAMLAGLAFVAPPAHADHGGTTPGPVETGGNKNHPPNAETHPVPPNHENPPQLKDHGLPMALCVVSGGVDIVPNYTAGGPQHNLNLYNPDPDKPDDLRDLENELAPQEKKDGSINDHSADPITRNLWNNPSHSHYVFAGVIIICVGLPTDVFTVEATGGNDGHYFNIYNFNPVTGDDGNCSIAIPFVNNKKDPKKEEKKNEGGTCIPPTIGEELHAKNEHHGSVNESAWSHGSGYNCVAAGEPAGCPTKNKGNIQSSSSLGVDVGWVKYIRVGPVVYAWGAFKDGPNDNRSFDTILIFSPTGQGDGNASDPSDPADPPEFLLNGAAVLYDWDNTKDKDKPDHP